MPIETGSDPYEAIMLLKYNNQLLEQPILQQYISMLFQTNNHLSGIYIK